MMCVCVCACVCVQVLNMYKYLSCMCIDARTYAQIHNTQQIKDERYDMHLTCKRIYTTDVMHVTCMYVCMY